MKFIFKGIGKSLFCVLLTALLNGCAGSKQNTEDYPLEATSQDEYGEIEQLLGITPQTSNTFVDVGQEDLLTLLQAGEGQEENTATEDQTKYESNNAFVELRKGINELKKKLREKNKSIANLRQQVKVLEEDKRNNSLLPKTASYNYESDIVIDDYKSTYEEGLHLAKSRQYRKAIEIFESLLKNKSNHSLSDNAQYWIGECYFALGDYRAAIVAFEKVFTFSNSNKDDFAQYKLGLCYFHLKEASRARQEFQSFLDNYNNPTLENKAEKYLARL